MPTAEVRGKRAVPSPFPPGVENMKLPPQQQPFPFSGIPTEVGITPQDDVFLLPFSGLENLAIKLIPATAVALFVKTGLKTGSKGKLWSAT